MTATPPPDLWTWSLSVYGQPDVAAACLEAQDQYTADVNLALWAGWAGAVHGHLLTPEEIAAAQAAVEAWHAEVVVPLRTVRRRMKTGPAPAPDSMTEPLREGIKAAELEAERIEQAVLSAHPHDPRRQADPDAAIHANLLLLLGADGAASLVRALTGADIPRL